MSNPNPPTARTVKNALAKVFDVLRAPVYLIDSASQIVYVNQAMLQWTGCKLEEIVGHPCRYIASPADVNHNIKERFYGLAPPPDRLQPGMIASGCRITVVTDGQLQHRQCDFWPMATADDPDQAEFVIGVVNLDASPPTSLPASTLNFNAARNGYDPELLHVAIADLQHQLQQRFHLDSLVGSSEFVMRLRKQVVAAASNSLEMTIVGPPGSGRQHLARTIHQRRCQTPPTVLNTGIASDHRWKPGLAAVLQGAIADAQVVQASARQAIDFAKENQIEGQGRAGQRHLPIAWLVLQDADQLTAEAQTELWAALTDARSDLRIIATSKIDLIQAAAEGNFHRGLAWRISTLVINTVAIKERSADIPMLAQYFLEQRNSDRQPQIGRFDSAAVEMLMEYHWPGNMQELRSVVQQSADACSGSVITKPDLPESFHHALKALRVGQREQVSIDLDRYLEKIEVELIRRALGVAKGNKTKTATLLGLNRAKLLRRIQHLNLDDEATAAKTGQLDQLANPAPVDAQVEFQPVEETDAGEPRQ